MENFDLFYANTPVPMEKGTALHTIGYGLYIVTTRENGKDSGLVVNTVAQVGSNPTVLAVGINRANHSCGVVQRTGKLNVNVLTESAPFSLFQRFGFQSGRDTDKMQGLIYGRSENNLPIFAETALGMQSDIAAPKTVSITSPTVCFISPLIAAPIAAVTRYIAT